MLMLHSRGFAWHPLAGVRVGRGVLAAPVLACLAACAGDTVRPVDSDIPTGPGSKLEALPPETGLETLYTQRLGQAESLFEQGFLYAAASILSDLNYSKLTGSERARMLSVQTALDVQQGRSGAALARLRNQLPMLGGLQASLLAPLQQQTILLTESREGVLAAAATANAFLLTTETGDAETVLIEQIWKLLQRASPGALEAALEGAQGHWLGWLELAILSADMLQSPAMQRAQLSLWQERHRNHRANLRAPKERQLLQVQEQTPSSLAKRVALLLPLTGSPDQRRQSNDFLQGYMAAAFKAETRGWPAQELMVMDLLEQADLAAAYINARRAGAALVFALQTGPNDASTINMRPADGDPTLVLLKGEGTQQAASTATAHSLPTLSSASTDEVSNLIRRAYGSGSRRALLVRPDDSWGDARSDEMARQWRQPGTAILANAIYSGQSDYSSSIKTALNIDASEQRYQKLRQIMGEPAQFFPRRRQDLDSVFLFSRNAQEARSLKPLLAFHYAGDLPVYASARLFSGRPDPQRDQDLNGATIMLSPWVLDKDGPLQSTLFASESENLNDAQALGADAFALQWRLADLTRTNIEIRGYGGLLWRDEEGRQHRERRAASFSDGLLTPLQ